MLKQNLVSIISPCYNGEEYISTFLDSLLQQDYPSVELIFVDDGSSDGTRAKVLSYVNRFKERGYELRYVHKENGGQASAINVGLKYVTGEFVMWMDSDDALVPDALSIKVEFLHDHPNIGFVICQGYMVLASDPNKVIGIQMRQHGSNNDDLFKDLINDTNVIFTPAAYLTRTTALFKAIPQRHIFESREGQNWQLLLPLAYTTTYGYIDKPLYLYVVREKSHSRKHRDYRDQVWRFNGFAELQSQTVMHIPDMPISEKERWLHNIQTITNRRKIRLALDNYHFRDWIHCWSCESSWKAQLKYNPVSFYTIKAIRSLNSTIKHILQRAGVRTHTNS